MRCSMGGVCTETSRGSGTGAGWAVRPHGVPGSFISSIPTRLCSSSIGSPWRVLWAGSATCFPAHGVGCKGQGRARSILLSFPLLGPVTLAVLRLAWEDKGCLVRWHHPSLCFKLAGCWGCRWLCSPGTLCLLAAGRGDTEYGDLEEEGKTQVPSSQCNSGHGCHTLCSAAGGGVCTAGGQRHVLARSCRSCQH